MTVLNLHKIEKKILLTLVKHDKLDSVRRGIEWLKYKGLVSVSVRKESLIQQISKPSEDKTSEDKIGVIDHLTLPERRMIDEIKKTGRKNITISELAKLG